MIVHSTTDAQLNDVVLTVANANVVPSSIIVATFSDMSTGNSSANVTVQNVKKGSFEIRLDGVVNTDFNGASPDRSTYLIINP